MTRQSDGKESITFKSALLLHAVCLIVESTNDDMLNILRKPIPPQLIKECRGVTLRKRLAPQTQEKIKILRLTVAAIKRSYGNHYGGINLIHINQPFGCGGIDYGRAHTVLFKNDRDFIRVELQQVIINFIGKTCGNIIYAPITAIIRVKNLVFSRIIFVPQGQHILIVATFPMGNNYRFSTGVNETAIIANINIIPIVIDGF